MLSSHCTTKQRPKHAYMQCWWETGEKVRRKARDNGGNPWHFFFGLANFLHIVFCRMLARISFFVVSSSFFLSLDKVVGVLGMANLVYSRGVAFF